MKNIVYTSHTFVNSKVILILGGSKYEFRIFKGEHSQSFSRREVA